MYEFYSDVTASDSQTTQEVQPFEKLGHCLRLNLWLWQHFAQDGILNKMFWKKNKKIKRQNLEERAPRKRKSFFEKQEEKVPNKLFSKIIFRFVLLVFLGSVTYVLFFSPFLEIKKVDLEGIVELNYDDVYGKIGEILNKKDFRFISRSNLILLPSDRIKVQLQNDFKKISGVEIKKIFPDSVIVKIIERKALLMWCSAGPCYIVDENGYAYTWADFESEEVKQNNLLSIVDNSGKSFPAGEKILDEDYIKFVISLKDELEKETEIKITNEYHTDSKMAEEVRVKTEEGWEIFFSTALPMEDSIQTLKTFLEKEMADKDKSKLEYVDLRAENKVYYKFKNNEQNNSEETVNKTETQQPAQQNVKKDDKKKKN